MQSKLFNISVSLVIIMFTGALAGAEVAPSQSDMLRFLKENAVSSPNCFYAPFHYIDLNAQRFLIRAIVPSVHGDSFDFRGLTATELQMLNEVIGQLPMFRLVISSGVQFWFDPVAGSSSEDLVKGMYILKRALDTRTTELYIDSSKLCPAGVSVHNF